MDAMPVVNHLLWLGFKEKVDDLNSIKLQKMLYFVHGWYMAITNEILIDEPFYKGQYGPVIPTVVEALKIYNGMPIDDYVSQWNEECSTICPLFVNLKNLPQFESIVNQVWKQYYPLNSIQLSSLASCPESPWEKTASSDIISNELIKQYFINKSYENHSKNSTMKTI